MRDELDLGAGAAVEWAMHTRADITVAPDGRSATLTQGGVVLEAHLDAATAGTFAVADAVPAATSPNPMARRPARGYASSWST
ncbi:MAG: hypothetical protein R2699_15100 [Acidimicrobiales bacterium]